MISEKYNPERNLRKIIGLKAESILHRVTHNPSNGKPGEILRINIPQLSENVVIVPGSVSLVFELNFSNSLIIHDVISQPERPIRVRWMSLKLNETPVENH